MSYIINQKRLAKEIDFSVEHVSRFVNRKSCYSGKLVKAIASVTGIDELKLATARTAAIKRALDAFYKSEIERMSK